MKHLAVIWLLLLACGDSKPPRKVEPMGKPWTVVTERVNGPAMTLYRLESDGTALYWTSCPGLSEPCTLARLAHDAAAPVALATLPGLRVFALDAGHVYFGDGTRLLRVAKSGGAPSVIATDIAAWDIAIADDLIYVAVGDTRRMTGGNPNPRAGQMIRFTKDGARTVLGEHTSSMPRLAIDDRRIFFTTDTGVSAMPRAGGDVEQLAHDDRNPPMSIAIDDGNVYFSAGGEVRRVAKRGGTVDVLYRAQIILGLRVAADGVVYAARNLAFDRGKIAERAALVRIRDGRADVLAEIDHAPQRLALDGAGLYDVLVGLGAESGKVPDRIVAYPR
jgi:hypothetical protein